jgi:hypothetical protein
MYLAQTGNRKSETFFGGEPLWLSGKAVKMRK